MSGRNSACDLLAGLALAACLAAPLPLAAQTGADAGGETGAGTEPPALGGEGGPSLIEQGATLLFRGILSELAPEIESMTDEMAAAMALLGPALGDLARLVDDIGNYELPERLGNGDILIRRKADAPPPPPLGEGLQRLLTPDEEAAPPAPEPPAEAPKLDL